MHSMRFVYLGNRRAAYGRHYRVVRPHIFAGVVDLAEQAAAPFVGVEA